jgi:hypothetical protein
MNIINYLVILSIDFRDCLKGRWLSTSGGGEILRGLPLKLPLSDGDKTKSGEFSPLFGVDVIGGAC